MELALRNGTVFNKMLQCVEKLIETVNIRINPDGFVLEAMDASHIGYIGIYMHGSRMTYYKCAISATIGLNIGVFLKIAGDVKDNEAMLMRLKPQGDSLFVSCIPKEKLLSTTDITKRNRGGGERHHEIRLIDLDMESVEVPEFPMIVSVRMLSDYFQAIMSKVAAAEDLIFVIDSEQGLKLMIRGDSGKTTWIIPPISKDKKGSSLPDLSDTQRVHVKFHNGHTSYSGCFASSYLVKYSKAAILAPVVTIIFSQNADSHVLLKLQYVVEEDVLVRNTTSMTPVEIIKLLQRDSIDKPVAKLEFFLAPKTEGEEIEEALKWAKHNTMAEEANKLLQKFDNNSLKMPDKRKTTKTVPKEEKKEKQQKKEKKGDQDLDDEEKPKKKDAEKPKLVPKSVPKEEDGEKEVVEEEAEKEKEPEVQKPKPKPKTDQVSKSAKSKPPIVSMDIDPKDDEEEEEPKPEVKTKPKPGPKPEIKPKIKPEPEAKAKPISQKSEPKSKTKSEIEESKPKPDVKPKLETKVKPKAVEEKVSVKSPLMKRKQPTNDDEWENDDDDDDDDRQSKDTTKPTRVLPPPAKRAKRQEEEEEEEEMEIKEEEQEPEPEQEEEEVVAMETDEVADE